MLQQLGRAFAAEDPPAVVAKMTDDVILRVAVHDEPFEGAPAARQILETVLDGVLHHIEVGEIIADGAVEVLMFSAKVAEHPGAADGLLIARLDEHGRITDLTVFLRPLAALQALADEMGRRMGGPRPGGE